MRSGVLGRLTSGELSATGSKVEDNIMRIGAESKTPGMRLATGVCVHVYMYACTLDTEWKLM